MHDGCQSASAGKARAIKAVTVFGNAAIVTESNRRSSRRGTGRPEDVFNYANGHWGFSPSDLSIYHHGSVAADIAAAKAAGFCTSRKTHAMKARWQHERRRPPPLRGRPCRPASR